MTGTNFNAFTLSGVTLLLALTLAPAVAQETEFNIEAQPLAKALLEFNEQSGLTVAARRDLVADKTAPAVHGEMEPEVALGRILSGTGLKLTQLSSGGYTITVDAADLGKYRSGRSPVPMARNQIVAVQSQTAASRSEATRSGRSDERGVGIVTGKVTDERTGANLKGAKVTIKETGQWTSTNDLGEFRLFNVPAGSATLTVSYLGYAGQSAIVGVRSAGTSQDFALKGGSEIEEIVVFGQRSARALALNQERTSAVTSTVLASDFLGQFEGQTISDVLRRAPGVSFVESEVTGDGTNIIIRGLEADFNTITLNGLRLPESSGTGRSSDLSNILTDSISKVTISKSLTPSQDGTGTGGLVDIETKGPLDRPRRFASFGIEAGRRDSDFENEYLVSGTISGLFGNAESFGMSLSVQYREQETDRVSYFVSPQFGQYMPLNQDGSVNTRSRPELLPGLTFPYEPGVDEVYASLTDNSTSEAESSDLNVSISTQWKPNDNSELRFDYSRLDNTLDASRRTATIFLLDGIEALPIPELGDEIRGAYVWQGGFFGDDAFLVNEQTVSQSRVENVTDSFSFRGETVLSNWQLNYKAGYSIGERQTPFDRDVEIDQTFDVITTPIDLNFLLPPARDNTIDGRVVSLFGPLNADDYPVPLFNEAGFAYFNDPNNLFLDKGFESVVFGQNERITGAFDVRYNYDQKYMKYLQFGLFSESSRFENGQATSRRFSGSGSLADLGFELAADNLSRIGLNGGFDLVSLADISGLWATLDRNPNVSAVISEIDDITGGVFTEEDNLAAYAEARVDIRKLEIVGGFRLESVDVAARNKRQPLIFLEDGTQDTERERSLAVLVDQEGRQTELLPRVALTYRENNNLLFRASYSKTVARPRVTEVGGAEQVVLDLRRFWGPNGDQPRLSIFSGNVDLDPASTDNFDIGVEYFFDNVGVLKASLFYKDIENALSGTTFALDSLDGITLPNDPLFQNLPDDIFITGSVPKNSPFDAEIWGFELVAEKQLTFLPGIWSSLGVFGNYTYSDSEQTIEASILGSDGAFEVVPIKAPIDQSVGESGTVGVSYNRYNIDASLAYTFQDRRLDLYQDFGLSLFDEADDSLDFRAEYRIDTKSGLWRIFVAGNDLLKGTEDADVRRTYGGEGNTPKIVASGNYLGGKSVTVGVVASF